MKEFFDSEENKGKKMADLMKFLKAKFPELQKVNLSTFNLARRKVLKYTIKNMRSLFER